MFFLRLRKQDVQHDVPTLTRNTSIHVGFLSPGKRGLRTMFV